MKIHEYQAKEIIARYGVKIPKGQVAFNPQEARKVAETIGKKVVVKAQIHAGGRGKGGGIKTADNPAEAEKVAGQIIGMTLVTHQTGPEGRKVKSVLVEEASNVARELYIGVVVDRNTAQPVLIASAEGGMEIEEVAKKNPEKILREGISPITGLLSFQLRRLTAALGITKEQTKAFAAVIQGLVNCFQKEDCTLAEINPLIVTPEGDIMALDAKLNLDDNGLFRHPDQVKLRDLAEEDPLEVEASKFNLNYIHLDGNVGCMVNGAGLAMATMDIIKYSGGEPANFLDVGGGASAETIGNGFRIILGDPKVKAILVNIFGGIVRCDRVATGIVQAAQSLPGGLQVPLVVRLEGTNAKEAGQILKESKLNIVEAKGLKAAAEKVVSFIKK
ncbi:MAG: ADP-forming succinate--CoA ligase subunit beta [bacterium]|nr:ADP-forming succinate--CoA ligase subunit beta [bacterium]